MVCVVLLQILWRRRQNHGPLFWGVRKPLPGVTTDVGVENMKQTAPQDKVRLDGAGCGPCCTAPRYSQTITRNGGAVRAHSEYLPEHRVQFNAIHVTL